VKPALLDHVTATVEHQMEEHRHALTAHCRRILGSPIDAEDAVQEALVRAWRGVGRFDGRAPLRSWLFSIATNVCLDMLGSRARRAASVDMPVTPAPDPGEVAVARETIRLAFVEVLHNLPPRQRAVLMLCEVLRWTAAEAADLLGTSIASVNSALQRARSTLAGRATDDRPRRLAPADRAFLAGYVEAFERDDIDALTSLIRADARRPAR